MGLKRRLERLEKAGAVRRVRGGRGTGAVRPAVSTVVRPGRLRVGRCLTEHLAGSLAADAYLPGMDTAERAYLDGLAGALQTFARGAQEVLGPDGTGGAPR
jgi:hypothetical protein